MEKQVTVRYRKTLARSKEVMNVLCSSCNYHVRANLAVPGKPLVRHNTKGEELIGSDKKDLCLGNPSTNRGN